jgi:chromosome segregation ATPase
MSSLIQTNKKSFNGLDKTNSATIRRTFIERGIRPIENNHTDLNSSAIKKINQQHQNEQQELQELNVKLSSYLGHVHDLETFNGQLLAEIDELRRKWGDNTEQLNKTHGPQLRAFREGIDDSLRDQVLQELQLKRYEYDIGQTQERINAFEDNTSNRLNTMQDELNNSINNLEQLKNQFNRNSADLIQERNYLENLGNEFDGLQIELLNHRLERIMVENELQTLREHAAFQKANYQAQREEILSLSK